MECDARAGSGQIWEANGEGWVLGWRTASSRGLCRERPWETASASPLPGLPLAIIRLRPDSTHKHNEGVPWVLARLQYPGLYEGLRWGDHFLP